MARSASVDPYEKFRFVIDIDFGGNKRAGFMTCDLPTESIGEITYREGNYGDTVEKSAGMVNYADISLSRGMTDSIEFYSWMELHRKHQKVAPRGDAAYKTDDERTAGEASNEYRKDLTISVLNREGEVVKTFKLYNASIAEFSPGDGLDANAEEKLIESLTLRYEHYTME